MAARSAQGAGGQHHCHHGQILSTWRRAAAEAARHVPFKAGLLKHACILEMLCDNRLPEERCLITESEGSIIMFESFPRITPFLWFDNNAEEAVNFYLSVFKNSRRLEELRNTGDAPGPKGGILTISFELDRQKFTALNGGPLFKFNESVSFVVQCDTQQEIDEYWSKLTAGGTESRCGWLKDRFGLSWQIIPARLPDLIKHPKAMQAMLKMKKLDIAALERAARS